jgi:hypothetical protein
MATILQDPSEAKRDTTLVTSKKLLRVLGVFLSGGQFDRLALFFNGSFDVRHLEELRIE